MTIKKHILPTIVIAQFCCTSLWFASNCVLNDLISTFDLSESILGHLTSAVQFGFIIGTLTFAILTIADRYSPSLVFFVCAVLGALSNAGLLWEGHQAASILSMRFATGFFLAGIYPVGMKIAADYFDKGLGKSLGFLVGALVLGTGFPHIFKGIVQECHWELVIISTSIMAIVGGSLIYKFVPNGPYRKHGKAPDLSAFFKVFSNRKFRAPAFGYFGHMWELYAFWTFVPVLLTSYFEAHNLAVLNISFISFLIIGVGSVACVIGGYLAQSFGAKKVAQTALLLSCICCLISPVVFSISNSTLFIGYLLFWGMVVIADSPMFSTLVAKNAAPEIKGTALTIVNCIGFAITIISIQLLNTIREMTDSTAIFMLLAIGPILGLIALAQKES